jgi:hypothetical protein
VPISTAIGTSGNEAFLQSARIDLDKGCENTRKKAVSDSGEGALLLIGNWRKPLRLRLETATLKNASLPGHRQTEVVAKPLQENQQRAC